MVTLTIQPKPAPKVEMVDVTPSWVQAASMLYLIIRNTDSLEALESARAELLRMAQLADAYCASKQ